MTIMLARIFMSEPHVKLSLQNLIVKIGFKSFSAQSNLNSFNKFSILPFACAHNQSTTATGATNRPARPIFNINERNFSQSKKILTIPNVLSGVRLASAPLLGYFLLNGMYRESLYFFIITAFTDMLDGFIARRYPSQASRLGEIVDPLADKVLINTCFITMTMSGLIPFWLTKSVFIRDFILVISGAIIRYMSFSPSKSVTIRQYFDFERYPTLKLNPSSLSKFNTGMQCMVVAAHLANALQAGQYGDFTYALHALHGATFLTTLLSLVDYSARAQRSFGAKYRTNHSEAPPHKQNKPN